jgi:translation initiation factor 3 subunit M
MQLIHFRSNIPLQGNIANAISTIQANKVTEDGSQGMQGLMIR